MHQCHGYPLAWWKLFDLMAVLTFQLLVLFGVSYAVQVIRTMLPGITLVVACWWFCLWPCNINFLCDLTPGNVSFVYR